ncbi:DUF2599 domain-containing protein [Streptomyces sp. B-S-A8]|uniref:DUF2599 domain-containing protein n=1 Tax=Streptomyces solicavernae TaxID=3043614 RepID=A0ABT6RUY2_9ACTN|nr:DUF2599 domain-containing protein [Streptomyces sp. B-S-A8]MDI3388247.1 DUF2599 domain-containing protein [Streptomyces sp. B-S-A8]
MAVVRRLLGSAAGAAVLLGSGLVAPAQAAGTPTGSMDGATAEAVRIAERIDEAFPDTGQDPARARARPGQGLVADGHRLRIDLPDTSRDTLTLARTDTDTDTDTGAGTGTRTGTVDRTPLTLGLPKGAAQRPAQPTKDGTVAYPDALPHTDLAVQPLQRSARVQAVLKDAAAPTELTYPVDVPEGGRLSQGEDGSVAVLDARGNPVGGIDAPTARDADGKAVPASYRIEGHSVVQTVRHDTAAHPVVTDAQASAGAILSARWEVRGDGPSFYVWTADWFRHNQLIRPNTGTVGAWAEVLVEYGHLIPHNRGGLYDQFACHHQFAQGNPVWHLEDWRQDGSYLWTVWHECNPPRA